MAGWRGWSVAGQQAGSGRQVEPGEPQLGGGGGRSWGGGQGRAGSESGRGRGRVGAGSNREVGGRASGSGRVQGGGCEFFIQ